MSPGTGIRRIRSGPTRGAGRSDAPAAGRAGGNRVGAARDGGDTRAEAAAARGDTGGGRTPGARRATHDCAGTRGGVERRLAEAGGVRGLPPDGDVQLERL